MSAGSGYIASMTFAQSYSWRGWQATTKVKYSIVYGVVWCSTV